VDDERLGRRQFLSLAAAGAVCAATAGAGCTSRDKPAKLPEAKGRPELRIAIWSQYIPAYDTWFDQEYTRQWGEEHDVDVIVDHVPYAELPARGQAEVAAGRGHDIFGFITPPAHFEDAVVDHRDIVEEVEGKLGKLSPLQVRNVLNPKTGKYFAFPEFWAPNPVHYRTDLWAGVGGAPSTWDDVLRAAPALKREGHPVGLGMSADDDSGFSLLSVMNAFGSSLQDEAGQITVNSPATVEAVKFVTALYRAGMTDEVFTWESPSNNRLLDTGRGSFILNAISAMRGAEDQDPALAGNIGLRSAMAGPGGRFATQSVVNALVIWRFAQNPETARRFLVDLAVHYREAFLRSRFYNVPCFPGAVSDLAGLLANDRTAKPADKYEVLADAESWSTNIGYPGHATAAVMDVFNRFTIPKMFAAAAKGEMTPEDTVKAAEAEMQPIFDRWREQGKI
jgi:multiple sugar transport system substrate-binding protein